MAGMFQSGLPENRNQPESTAINRNQPLNLRNQLPENRNQPESTAINQNQHQVHVKPTDINCNPRQLCINQT